MFTERVMEFHFKGVFDIMSKIGGFNASIFPILNWFGPFLVLYFLQSLCKIIKENLEAKLKVEYNELFKLGYHQLSQLVGLVDDGKLEIEDYKLDRIN